MQRLRRTAGLLLLSATASLAPLVMAGDSLGSAGLLLWVEGETELRSLQGTGERIRPGLILKTGQTISLSRGRGLILWADGGLKILEPGQELAVPQPVSKAGDEGMISRLAAVLLRVHQTPIGEPKEPPPAGGQSIRLLKPRNSAILAADLSFHWSGQANPNPDQASLLLKAARVGFELVLPVKLSAGRARLPKETGSLLPGLRYSWCLRAEDDRLSPPAWFTILSPDEENHLRERVSALRKLDELPPPERLLAEAELLAAYGLFNRAVQTLEEVLDLNPDLTSARELLSRLSGISELAGPAGEAPGSSQASGVKGTGNED